MPMQGRGLYAYVDVSVEQRGVEGRGLYGFADIAAEVVGVTGRALYGFVNIAAEFLGVLGRALYQYLRVVFAVSPNTPPEWHLFDGWEFRGVIREVKK